MAGCNGACLRRVALSLWRYAFCLRRPPLCLRRHLFVYEFCYIELLKREIFIGNCRKSTLGCTERMLACHVGPACAVVLRERYASGREQGKELLRIQGIRV